MPEREPPPPSVAPNTPHGTALPEIPIEIVSEEEMALLDAALAAARASLVPYVPSPRLLKNVRSINSISLLSKRRPAAGDIEDSGDLKGTQKKNRVTESLLRRFRRNRGLSVTDITATEWCERQMEFVLVLGKARKTKAMMAGSARHVKLEEEVIKRVAVRTESVEDMWAVRLMNFIIGTNQLLFDGLTRELPLIGFASGAWIVGVIDEIRMPSDKITRNPKLIDTKTRVQATLPGKPQQRNGRLQVMCYKLLWDNLAAENFPARQFFDFFGLNPHHLLSEEIRSTSAMAGIPVQVVQTLEDLVGHFKRACRVLPSAHDELLLRYEFQKDNSLIGEDHFFYDSEWLKTQLQGCLEFWFGERDAKYVAEDERWKCRHCQFASACPATAADPASSSTTTDASPR